MFIITDRAVFAPDEDHSNEFRNEYYTEVDLTTLVISEDLTMRPAYYQVFREYKENKRILREWLYASSELSKIKSFKAESILKKSARSAARKKKAAKPGGRKKKGGAG